jgi:hypothetical protein
MFDSEIKKRDIPRKLRDKDKRTDERKIIICVEPTFEFEILREKNQPKHNVNRRRNKEKQIFARKFARRIGQVNDIKPNANTQTIRNREGKISQPLIAVIDIRKPDKRRNQARTKQNKQCRQPKISCFFMFEITRNEERGKNRALQDADENNDASRIEKIQFQAFDEKKINHR